MWQTRVDDFYTVIICSHSTLILWIWYWQSIYCRPVISRALLHSWATRLAKFVFIFTGDPPPQLPSAKQHPSYGDCLEVKREYYQYCSVLDYSTCNVHSQQHAYMSRLGLSHWDPYAMRRCWGGCLELYYCNMVEWIWLDSSLISTTNWFSHPENDL